MPCARLRTVSGNTESGMTVWNNIKLSPVSLGKMNSSDQHSRRETQPCHVNTLNVTVKRLQPRKTGANSGFVKLWRGWTVSLLSDRTTKKRQPRCCLPLCNATPLDAVDQHLCHSPSAASAAALGALSARPWKGAEEQLSQAPFYR